MNKYFLPLSVNIADGEAHRMPDGRVYLYGSLDKSAGHWCSDEYVVISSEDLIHWEVSETSFSTANVPWAGKTDVAAAFRHVKRFEDLPEQIRMFLPPEALQAPIELLVSQIVQRLQEQNSTENVQLFAPDAICRDGKYYLYFCMSDETEGVAVSESPNGPFRDTVQLPVRGIDPAVFIDRDGQAYYYWGQFSANAARLTPDMTHIEEGSIRQGVLTEAEHHFHEGSSMRRRGDTYYYVYAGVSRGNPTCLEYATAKSPLGPFTYRGVIVDNRSLNPESWNNHGSIEEIGGQWYVFFHISTAGRYSRRACMSPIEFDENGLIREVTL